MAAGRQSGDQHAPIHGFGECQPLGDGVAPVAQKDGKLICDQIISFEET